MIFFIRIRKQRERLVYKININTEYDDDATIIRVEERKEL